MAPTTDPLEQAIEATARLRQSLTKGTSRQVRNQDERALSKATAHTWFRSIRPMLGSLSNDGLLSPPDEGFAELLEFSDHNVTRARYLALLEGLKADLIKLRSIVLTKPLASTGEVRKPRFDRLIADPNMLRILDRRWDEILRCFGAGAHLATTVMIGGLLEAFLLARINHMKDLSPVFTAKAAPRDKAGKTKPLKEWGLKNYLDVAEELGWIRQSGKNVGEVLRDYRNLIHPEKELTHLAVLNEKDTSIFLAVFVTLAEQIAGSV